MNNRIRAKEVRVIDVDGKQLGVMHIRRALKIAQDKGLDLVEVAPTANPPVCRILDYGRYRYEQEKLAKEAKKKQKGGDVKTIRLRPAIGAHDIETKIRNAIEFLEDGDKVKFVVIFRSREFGRPQVAEQLLRKVATALEEHGVIEKQPGMDGRQMVMVIAPAKKPAPKPKPATTGEGGSTHVQEQNEDEQNRRQAVQAHSDGQTDAQESREQPPVPE
ncbi:MAG: translation initiation factor IF-3 [Fimbriimonadales bacterium]|nr:translation initiation factor IF-3 [Fimbriimonadales bacterium]